MQRFSLPPQLSKAFIDPPPPPHVLPLCACVCVCARARARACMHDQFFIYKIDIFYVLSISTFTNFL
jgi:hypothetical protein